MNSRQKGDAFTSIEVVKEVSPEMARGFLKKPKWLISFEHIPRGPYTNNTIILMRTSLLTYSQNKQKYIYLKEIFSGDLDVQEGTMR